MDRENALGATAANERPAVVFETEADTPEQAADHMIRAIYEEDGYESGSTGEERHDRVDGQQERGGVAQGTSVLETRQQRSAAESVRAAVRAAGVGGTEAVKLGIENTRKGSTVQVVPESVYTDEMRSVAKQNSKDGVKTVFVVGAIELADGSYARGAVSDDGKTVWLRADHASFSVTQINNHEAFHRLAKRDKGLVQQTAERIVSHYGEEDLANMMLAYAEAYHGVDLDTDALLEEILADAYAGMNALGHELYGAGDATRYTEQAVTEAVESAGRWNMRNVMAQSAKENATQTDGVKMSREITVDGKPVILIENSGLTNKQCADLSLVEDLIADHIGEFYRITESGQPVYIGKDLPNEYVYSKYSQAIRKSAKWRSKAKTENALGLLIETAHNRRWEKTRHESNKDAKYGMYRYDVSFAVPVKDENGNPSGIHGYDAELLIRNASDGKKYLYDIVGIKENTAIVNDLTKRQTRLAAYAASQRGASTDSIRDTAKNSKPNFSRDTDANYLEMAKDPAKNEAVSEDREAVEIESEEPGGNSHEKFYISGYFGTTT